MSSQLLFRAWVLIALVAGVGLELSLRWHTRSNLVGAVESSLASVENDKFTGRLVDGAWLRNHFRTCGELVTGFCVVAITLDEEPIWPIVEPPRGPNAERRGFPLPQAGEDGYEALVDLNPGALRGNWSRAFPWIVTGALLLLSIPGLRSHRRFDERRRREGEARFRSRWEKERERARELDAEKASLEEAVAGKEAEIESLQHQIKQKRDHEKLYIETDDKLERVRAERDALQRRLGDVTVQAARRLSDAQPVGDVLLKKLWKYLDWHPQAVDELHEFLDRAEATRVRHLVDELNRHRLGKNRPSHWTQLNTAGGVWHNERRDSVKVYACPVARQTKAGKGKQRACVLAIHEMGGHMQEALVRQVAERHGTVKKP
jgi:hypothetical protein